LATIKGSMTTIFHYSSSSEEEEDVDDFEMAMRVILNDEIWRLRLRS
jgi:hypothetical protein